MDAFGRRVGASGRPEPPRFNSLGSLAGQEVELKRTARGLVVEHVLPTGLVLLQALFAVPLAFVGGLCLWWALKPSRPRKLASVRSVAVGICLFIGVVALPVGAAIGYAVSAQLGMASATGGGGEPGWHAQVAAAVGALVFPPLACAIMVPILLAQQRRMGLIAAPTAPR